MTYYGVPSRGCDGCRRRKVKCDRAKPSCERCRQAGHVCPGYRQLSTVIFRQENQRILNRVGRGFDRGGESTALPLRQLVVRNNNLHRHEAGNFLGSGTWPALPASHTQRQQHTEQDQMGIIPSVQIGRDEAICYFHDRFAWVSASRYFVFSSSQPPALLNMAAALGLASFSFTRKSTAMQRAAAAEYSTALQSINHMLADPATATLDSTLAVVILMSFFEILTGHSPPCTKSWTNHASGAASIVALRGPGQLESPAGHQLLLEAKGMMLSTSLIHKIPVSQALVDCTRLAMEISTPSQNHGEHVFIITGEVANLRAALEENPVINDTAPVFDAVDKLTARLREWRLMAPVDWKYDTMEVDEQSPGAETWYGFIKPVGGRYSIYSGDHVVVGWSNYRMSCILLAELLLGLLKRQVMASSPPSTAALAKCRALRRTMDQMATDICASVPYLLGLKTSAAGGALPDLSGAYMVLMPLWVAACVEGPGHPLRHSAMFLLEVLARRVGIRHASLQRHFLVSVEGMAEWLDNFPETR